MYALKSARLSDCLCVWEREKEKEWLSVFFWVVQKDRAYLCVYVQV